jgi:hypothetical protein
MKQLANMMAKAVEGKYFFYRDMRHMNFYRVLGANYSGLYVASVSIRFAPGRYNKVLSKKIVSDNIYRKLPYGVCFLELPWHVIRDAELVTKPDFIAALDEAFANAAGEEYYYTEEHYENTVLSL